MSILNQIRCFVGIDVAKDHLDLGIRPSGETKTFTNNEDGISKLKECLSALSPELVVVEATGGLEIPMVSALAVALIPVSVVNPRQVRDFAKATGKLAKTDAIDALVLAHFGEAIKPQVRPLKSEEAFILDGLLARRHQILEMITAENNRLLTASKRLKDHINKHITWLKDSLREVDDDLDMSIRNSPAWKEKDILFQTVPGVGRVMSLALITELPEIGTLGRRQIAALAGVAPLNRDSGKRIAPRSVWAGRAYFRSVLYMSTLVATRHNAVIREFYNRLCKNGKNKKVALTACMRKMLTILNSMAKNNTPWCPAS